MLTHVKRFLVWQQRGGFKATSKTFYTQAHGAKALGDYLPDAAYRPMGLTNGRLARDILNDKLLFERLLSKRVSVHPNLALIERGEVFSPSLDGVVQDIPSLLRFAQTHPLVLKPALGDKGRGVFSLRAEGGGFSLDGTPTPPEGVLQRIAALDGYLVTPWVQPAAYATAVYPDAGHTVRVITLQDPGADHQPFIAAALHKFGTSASAPTDNGSRGGLFTPIDLETGVLGSALESPGKTAGRPVWHDTHPDTGATIKGLTVPRWDQLKTELLELVAAFPFFRYVGWDVLVTEAGFCVLEGNPAPVILSLQLERPLLTDARVRRFIAHYHIRTPGLQFRV